MSRFYYNYRCPLTIGMCREIVNFLIKNPTTSDIEISSFFSQKLQIPIHRLVITHLRNNQRIYSRLTSATYQNLRYYNQGYNYRLYTDQLTLEESQYFRHAKQYCEKPKSTHHAWRRFLPKNCCSFMWIICVIYFLHNTISNLQIMSLWFLCGRSR